MRGNLPWFIFLISLGVMQCRDAFLALLFDDDVLVSDDAEVDSA
jgi:hypothetical protein